MTPANIAYFSSARVTGIMQGLSDPRLLPQPLVWNTRIPDVPAVDEEVTAKYVGTLLIADLIADDAKAVTYSQGRFQFQQTQVPNLKMGLAMNQALINAMSRIKAMGGVESDDTSFFNDRWQQNVADVKYGVELRKEVFKLGMALDGFSYDRLGIKMSSVSWGMYSDLKITSSPAWTSTSGLPITDINLLRSTAMQRYGIDFDRATMTTPDLRAMVATTEYQNQVKNVAYAYLLGGPAPAATLQSDGYLKRQAELVIGGLGDGSSKFTIEIDDRRYWSQDNAGLITSNRFHPIGKVLLTSTANDGNRNAWDFANCPVTEGIVGSMFPSNVMGPIVAGRGPIGYTTLADASLNPPGTVTWGVARGAPRKHMNQASGYVSTGVSSETFDTSVPTVL